MITETLAILSLSDDFIDVFIWSRGCNGERTDLGLHKANISFFFSCICPLQAQKLKPIGRRQSKRHHRAIYKAAEKTISYSVT